MERANQFHKGRRKNSKFKIQTSEKPQTPKSKPQGDQFVRESASGGGIVPVMGSRGLGAGGQRALRGLHFRFRENI
jgi:hypothetical protein